MNNADFRGLLSSTQNSASVANGTITSPSNPISVSRPRPGAFTPRTIKNSTSNPFARGAEPPNKKFKTSHVKGTRLAAGYHDRAAERKHAEAQHNEKEQRLKALEEQVRLGQLDPDDFEKLRNEITGGDVGAKQSAKGLDRELLERVRKGEDVFDASGGEHRSDGGNAVESKDDNDAAFEDLERADVAPVKRETVEKKGKLALAASVAAGTGLKKSRNELLAEFRAQRKAEEEARTAAQRKGWKQDLQPGSSRLERDAKGREVLITMDEHGNVKRKVRKVPAAPPPPPVEEPEVELEEAPSKNNDDETDAKLSEKQRRKKKKAMQALGDDANYANLIEFGNGQLDDGKLQSQESDDDDIFAGVGDNYDPLAGLEDDASSEDEAAKGIEVEEGKAKPSDAPDEVATDQDADEASEDGAISSSSTSPPPGQTAGKSGPRRNYFSNTTEPDPEPDDADPESRYKDPSLLAAFKKASEISKREEAAASAQTQGTALTDGSKPNEGSTAAERLLGRRDRDLEDMDMGFGASVGGDDEDEGGDARLKLSEWKGIWAEGEEGGNWEGRSGKGSRKRGKKKRKGDKNSIADVLGAMGKK